LLLNLSCEFSTEWKEKDELIMDERIGKKKGRKKAEKRRKK